MKNFKTIAKELILPVLAIALPVVASAAFQGPGISAPGSPINSVTDLTGPAGIFCIIVNWLFYLLLVAAVIFVLVAAFKYLTSSGDGEGVKAAGGILLYAAIAVIVALLAKGIPIIASTFVGGTLGGFAGC